MLDYTQYASISYTHYYLTHWGRVTHICVRKLTVIGSDNGLSPGRRQAIIWSNTGILLIWPLGINFNDVLIEIYIFSFKKMHLKLSSAKWHPCCLGLNVLNTVTSWVCAEVMTHVLFSVDFTSFILCLIIQFACLSLGLWFGYGPEIVFRRIVSM